MAGNSNLHDSAKNKQDEFYTRLQLIEDELKHYRDHMEKRHKELTLFKRYTPAEYPKYDNYDAIEVGKTTDIPCDYEGMICVPITFMQYHNPDQFEILGATESEGVGFSAGLWDAESGIAQPLMNGGKKYKRIFIRRKREGVV